VSAERELAKPVALKAMGRFRHEAVAVDPKTGIVYQIEDREEPTSKFRLKASMLSGLPTPPRFVRGSGGRLLLSRQHGRQKPEFGLYFDGIGYSIGDFLSQEVAIPLAKPVNGHLTRSF
jgi:hypothetical protein